MRHSESIKEIATALSKAQGMMTNAKKDSVNPFYSDAKHLSKYADLASIVDACRDALTANGIAVVQSPAAEGNKIKLTTLLVHTSGEWMEGELEMTADKGTPQAFGSCITYARRYALAAFVGVAPSDDDDGNHASGNTAKANGRPKSGDPAPDPQRYTTTIREQTIDNAKKTIATAPADKLSAIAKRVKAAEAEGKIDADDVLYLMDLLQSREDELKAVSA